MQKATKSAMNVRHAAKADVNAAAKADVSVVNAANAAGIAVPTTVKATPPPAMSTPRSPK